MSWKVQTPRIHSRDLRLTCNLLHVPLLESYAAHLSPSVSLFPLFFLLYDLTRSLSARRLLSPRGEAVHRDFELGATASSGTKRHLVEEMQLQKATSGTSSSTDQVSKYEVADCSRQKQPSHGQSRACEEVGSKMKRAKRDLAADSITGHCSAFDLVDDALHISSDDEFPEFDIALLPSNSRSGNS